MPHHKKNTVRKLLSFSLSLILIISASSAAALAASEEGAAPEQVPVSEQAPDLTAATSEDDLLDISSDTLSLDEAVTVSASPALADSNTNLYPDASFTFRLGSVTATHVLPQETFKLPLYITNNIPVSSFRLTLSYSDKDFSLLMSDAAFELQESLDAFKATGNNDTKMLAVYSVGGSLIPAGSDQLIGYVCFTVENASVVDALKPENADEAENIDGHLPITIGQVSMLSAGSDISNMQEEGWPTSAITIPEQPVQIPIYHHHTYLNDAGKIDYSNPTDQTLVTCTEDGVIFFQCELCDSSVTETTPKLGGEHTWAEDGEIITQQTSCLYGTKLLKCTKRIEDVFTGTVTSCHATKEVYYAATDSEGNELYSHGAMEHHPAKPSTTTENGNVEYWQCPTCGLCFNSSDASLDTLIGTVEDTVVSDDHSQAELVQATPTVTTRGDDGAETTTYGCIQHWLCPVCEKFFDADPSQPGANELSDVENRCIPGDADGNNKITSFDATRILLFTSKKVDSINDANADSDGNGSITSFDATRVLLYTSKKVNTLSNLKK